MIRDTLLFGLSLLSVLVCVALLMHGRRPPRVWRGGRPHRLGRLRSWFLAKAMKRDKRARMTEDEVEADLSGLTEAQRKQYFER